MDDGTTHALIDYQQEAEKAVRDAQASVSKLARAYREGEPIDFVDIETPTPSQKVVLILNWITRNLQTWITELEQTGSSKPRSHSNPWICGADHQGQTKNYPWRGISFTNSS